MLKSTDDLRIRDIQELTTPIEVMRQHPRTDAATRTVISARHAFSNIQHGQDDRLAVVVGPCSIHDPVAALDYAKRLVALREQLGDRLEIIMRVYFEKPRTTVGWKGLINDPNLDGSFAIDQGLHTARGLLLEINNLGMPAACEFLDMTTPQYIADLVSWAAIGARTTESQIHRELASGLSCPVGFKNGTDGNVRIAIDAVQSATQPHHFMAVTKSGRSAIASTTGNEDCHIILRGGKEPNYDAANVDAACAEAEKSGIEPVLMIDASHANSSRSPKTSRRFSPISAPRSPLATAASSASCSNPTSSPAARTSSPAVPWSTASRSPMAASIGTPPSASSKASPTPSPNAAPPPTSRLHKRHTP